MRLAPSEVEEARMRSPLQPAIGVIHSMLSSLDEAARHIVAIADAEANLLWVTGDRVRRSVWALAPKSPELSKSGASTRPASVLKHPGTALADPPKAAIAPFRATPTAMYWWSLAALLQVLLARGLVEKTAALVAATGLARIAHQLFVTRKTLESHLGHVYSKLEIGSHKDLPMALNA
jgi:hypothetical protein